MFGWLFGRRTVRVSGPGTYSVEVVGESNYQKALKRASRKSTEIDGKRTTSAYLVCEKKNRHDPNAVRVEIRGRRVGYLDRSTAKAYRERLPNGRGKPPVVKCSAAIFGGSRDKPSLGVWLDLPRLMPWEQSTKKRR